MVLLGGLSIVVSVIGLYLLLFSSFKSNDTPQMTSNIIIKASRKIRMHREKKSDEEPDADKPNPQFILILETIVLGELVGLFFLWLTDDPLKYSVILFNGVTYLIASFLCSILTLFNAWLKKKMHHIFRIVMQIVTLVIGILLFNFSSEEDVVIPADYITATYYAFYITVVVALLTMLFNVVRGNKEEEVEFNYNNYLLLVIVSGLVIGASLHLAQVLVS
ncbi:MAG: hypothetical protein ACOY90_05605 [Candidatus Zhuqueibacterota bacterium]